LQRCCCPEWRRAKWNIHAPVVTCQHTDIISVIATAAKSWRRTTSRRKAEHAFRCEIARIEAEVAEWVEGSERTIAELEKRKSRRLILLLCVLVPLLKVGDYP
jgi:hypothetical protein